MKIKFPLFFFFFILFFSKANSQNAISFVTYSIGESKCKVSLPAEPGPATMEYSPDSSKVYTIEALDSTTGSYYHFGALVIELKEITSDKELLESYLDYLKEAFSIESSSGYQSAPALVSHPSAEGVSDTWKDKDGDTWKIMAWTSSSYMIIQFEYGPDVYPVTNTLNSFFGSVKFPGD